MHISNSEQVFLLVVCGVLVALAVLLWLRGVLNEGPGHPQAPEKIEPKSPT